MTTTGKPDMKREEAHALMEKFEAELHKLRLYDPQSANHHVELGGYMISWGVERGKPPDRHSYSYNFGVKLILNANGGWHSRKSKLHRTLKPMLKSAITAIEAQKGALLARDNDLMDEAWCTFELGWCATRMKRKIRMRDGYRAGLQVQIKGRKDNEGTKSLWLDGVLYHRELDTLVVKVTLGKDWKCPVEQAEVIYASGALI